MATARVDPALQARLAALTLRDEHRLRRHLARGRVTDRELADAEARIARRRASVPEISYPPQLPVSARREDLKAAIADHQVVVVAGETGSGKTTQLPKICLELGRGVRGAIVHTQPRRLAARTVAERIADELDVPLGGAIGYAVRFDDRAGQDSLVRLVTDGLLLAEIGRDRLLRRYDTVIVDEAHERSLNVDFLLGYLATLLPRRPDLKLVITSATIDPGQFSRHFGGAPVVEVSGRTYPVEVRYRADSAQGGTRPGDDPDPDPVKAIGDAVDELTREGPGDVLVFLSGEREIRDTADGLRGRFGEALEVLPLYSRLAAGEQQRVFKTRPEGRATRRVVLATNVAETSLTVPGIRYVVDPGTARVSRYSPRSKVQRLPIEPISQASADQRKGRCGRTADGVCVRLYGEEDFAARPRFTDPEVLRTSLASVLLAMAALDLGAIEEFPFLDPPDGRQVRDGVLLLQELGALDGERRLTPTGRRIARLPVDPRYARMVLEADRLSCAEEVIVVVAALSIQDPRERPGELRAQADQAHARFHDPDSDFAAFLNLWSYLREQQDQLSGNQFRKRCRAEFLSHLRVREWQDLVGQLRRAARAADVTLNQTPGDREHVHRALLSGLLSHVGVRDAGRREYVGARGARFGLAGGTPVSRKPPAWVMVAELVETSRLLGRTAARISPRWIEPLAEHLVVRDHAEPRWSARRAAVVATETVTLYGLPVVTGRTVPYAGLDPGFARAELIRRALVEGDWDARHRFLQDNRRLVAEVAEVQQRARRHDLLADESARIDFFDKRVPLDVLSGRHFDRWWKREQQLDPELLTYERELLLAPWAEEALAGRPAAITVADGTELELRYAFVPGDEADGVTARVPLPALAGLRADGLQWLVPALRRELVIALIRGLPKELRRPLVPVPDVADAVLAAVGEPGDRPLLSTLSSELERLRGVRVPPGAWDLDRLPPHLRMHVAVVGEDGAVLAQGEDLDALRTQLRPRLRAELRRAAPELERTGLTAWTIGTLPRRVDLPGTAGGVRAYPALVDEGATAGVRVLDGRPAQAEAMRAGTLRLLGLTAASPVRAVTDRLDFAAQVALADAPHAGRRALVDDAVRAATAALMDEAGGPAWDAQGFAALRSHVAGGLVDRTLSVLADVARVLDGARALRGLLGLPALQAAPLAPVREDVAVQLRRLVFAGFAEATGAARLGDLVRYLAAAARRLERAGQDLARDAARAAEVHELEQAYAARAAAHALTAEQREVPWLLEELRVSLFAQALGTPRPVSAKRIRRVLEQTGG